VQERTKELRAASSELVRKERLATLGQVSATVSHELRNPLGTIRNCLFTIRRRTQDSNLDLEKSLDRADTSIERCNGIISELLDYASNKEPIKQSASIDDWLARILDELKLPGAVELRRELCSGAAVAFDPDSLHQVIINLVDNACQAMTDEQATGNTDAVLTVSTETESDRVIVSFADTGPGISLEAQEKIFEPLYSTKTFGVGLGLPLVKKIIEQHDGTIEVESADGAGASLRLSFPVAEIEEGAIS